MTETNLNKLRKWRYTRTQRKQLMNNFQHTYKLGFYTKNIKSCVFAVELMNSVTKKEN